MRLSVYISEVVKVNQLSDIVATVNEENPSHLITGVLSYNHGYYLHIVEGDTADIASFDKTIRKDTRHKNLRKLFNFKTNKRYFSCWSINLAPLLKRNNSFLAIVDKLNKRIDSVSYDKRRLFSIFHTLAESKVASKSQINTLDPLVYSIDEWPDFESLAATSSLMSLCGSLMLKPTPFRKIVSENAHESEVELRDMLSQLNKAGYLKVAQMGDSTQSEPNNIQNNSQLNGIFNSIEKFSRASLKIPQLRKATA